jgi:phosphoribosyl 1,2-cyclic phosphodiesterase
MVELDKIPLRFTLLISHTHWDPIQGLPFFRPAYAAKSQLRILSAPGTRERLHTALVRQMDPTQFPVALDSLAGIRAIEEFAAPAIDIGRFTVRTIKLNHPGGCTGFRITASGKSVAYLPDHESYRSAAHSLRARVAGGASAEEELVKFLEGCEVLILDSQYDRAEYSSHFGWGHGCLDDSVALALRAGVEQLVLFHHDPNHDDAKIDAMVKEARRQIAAAGAALRVRAARELERLVPTARARRLAA